MRIDGRTCTGRKNLLVGGLIYKEVKVTKYLGITVINVTVWMRK